MKKMFACWLMVTGWFFFSFPVQAQTNTAPAVKKQTETSVSLEVIAIDNRIKVSNAPIDSRLEIYSIVGIKVAEIEMKHPSGEYILNLVKGYYIVKINETVRKIAIR
ncbi:MAG: T9SS type A sorting domain-containing protein [Bacteroidales bacterium]